MKKNTLSFSLFMAVLVVIGLGSCASTKVADNLDWVGTYTGTIPAASAEGINVRLRLSNDQTYTIRYEYVGRPEGNFESTGSFKWDKTRSIITLDSNDLPPYYKVGENTLTQLDMNGKVITGNFADMYILTKQP